MTQVCICGHTREFHGPGVIGCDAMKAGTKSYCNCVGFRDSAPMPSALQEWAEERRKHAETQRQLAEANDRIERALSICRDQNRLSGFQGKRDEAWAVATKVAGALMGEK